jgi:hypothetical protein
VLGLWKSFGDNRVGYQATCSYLCIPKYLDIDR